MDNSYTVCRKDQAERSVLIVGESPFYLERLFSALEDCRLTVVKTVASEELSGYDLYVFDGTAPAILPFDGSVLLVDPEELPNGLTFGEEKSGLFALSLGQNAPEALVSGVQTEEWTVQTFRPLSGSGLWQTVFQVEEEPVMAFKRSETGRSLAVLSFDLHDSNLPLCSSYLAFMKNLVGELSPRAVEKEEYAVGEEVRIYTARNGLLPKIRLPDGRVRSLIVSKGFSAFKPLETGVYTVFWSDGDREEASLHFYVPVDSEELNGRELTKAPVVPSAPENGDQAERSYAEWGWWILLALLILMLAEWGVYSYEQHGSGF